MNRNLRNALALLVFAVSAGVTSGHAQPPVEGAIASWDFEPGAGDTLRDKTGNGHHGIIHGARWTDGMRGKALQFRGEDWVAIPAHPRLNVRSFTFSVWLWQSGNGVRVPMMEWQVPHEPVGVHLTANTSGWAQDLPGAFYANLRPHDASASQPGHVRERNLLYTAASTAQGCRWNHVVLSYDTATSTARIHVNGRLRASWKLEPFIPRTTGDILLGRRSSLSPEWDAGMGLVGTLDQADLFNRALTEGEIAALYGRPPVDPLSLHLGMATHYAKVGDTVTVPLWISSDGKDSVGSLDMRLAYDTTVALLAGATLDTATLPGWSLAPIPPGRSPVDLKLSGTKRFSGARDMVLVRLRLRIRPEARTGASTVLTLSDIQVDGGRSAAVTHTPGRLFVIAPDIRYGDVSGDGVVDLLDAAAILAYSVGRLPPPDFFPNFTLAVADVSGNGIITSYDAALVLQFALGMLEEFPVETKVLAKRAAAATLEISAPAALGGNLYRYRLQGAGLGGMVGGEARLSAGPSVLRVVRIVGLQPGLRGEHRFDLSARRLDLAFSGNRKTLAGELALLEVDVEQNDSQPALRLESAYLDEGRIQAAGLPSVPVSIRSRSKPAGRGVTALRGPQGLRIIAPEGDAANWRDIRGRRVDHRAP